jgi:hypothetical protein
MTSSTPMKVDEKYKRTSPKTMIVSKEPVYSLRGCSHRKGLITYSMKQEDNKILCETLCLEESEGAIIFESIPEKVFLTIPSGATPIGSVGHAPDETNTRTTELGEQYT